MNVSGTLQKIQIFTAQTRNALSRGVHAFYRIALEPRSLDEDIRRRELILNVLVAAILAVVVIFFFFVTYAQTTTENYSGIQIWVFCFFIILFGALLALSRKGYRNTAAYLLAALYFAGTTYGIYAWGIELPIAALSYAAIIITASIVVGTGFGFAMAGASSIAMILLGWLQTSGTLSPDLSWRSAPLQFNDAIENSVIYAFIVIVSWLSNREIDASLRRARRSEADLKAERDSLEVRIEERTKELKAAQLDKVSQLYRFVEFGRLSSGIFHDILNPLTTMSLTVEHLNKGKAGLPTETREQIERAIRASKRIESFVEIARKQLDREGCREVFAPQSEIRDAIDLTLHKARLAGVDVRFEQPKGTVLLSGNSVKFFQVAVNLISNAIDSYAGIDRDRKEVVASLSRGPEGTTFTVRDEGSGIDGKLREAIFEPFFTTKAKGSGLGLGLSTTKGIVEKDFDGTIGVESVPGKGSTFTVTVPPSRSAEDRRRPSQQKP